MSSSRSRPTSARRKSSSPSVVGSSSVSSDYEYKAAYLVVIDDVDDPLTSMELLKNALAQSGRNVPKKRLLKYWTEDTEEVSFAEFCEICAKEPATTEDDLIKAFRKIDINGDGFITNDELRKTLTTRGDKMTEAEVQEIIDEVDENKDGKLNYSETRFFYTQFCTMLLGTQEKAKKLAIDRMEKKLKKKSRKDVTKPKPSPRSARRDSSDAASVTSSKLSLNSAGASDQGGSSEGEEEEKEEKKEEDDGDSDDSDDDIVIGSTISISSAAKAKAEDIPSSARSSSSSSALKEKKLPSVQSLVSHGGRLKRPRKLGEWNSAVCGGCFFMDADTKQISGHQYSLKLLEDSNVWINIEPKTIGTMLDRKDPIDTQVMVLKKVRERGADTTKYSLVTYTELRDAKGKYGVRCDLPRGEYTLLPFTSGCRLRARREEEGSSDIKLLRKKGDQYMLSKAFKEALSDIFKMCDLDGDGLLSREEFDLYNIRTSGEALEEEEWDVVEDHISLEDGKITVEGFIELNQMEANDAPGDTEELWVTLTSMGYNQDLVIDQACPFSLEVYAEDTEPELNAVTLDDIEEERDRALTKITMDKGESSKVKRMNDLYLHSLVTDFQAMYVIANKSHRTVTIELNCEKSRNCISHQTSLNHSVEIPRGQNKIVHHLMPVDEAKDWTIACTETVIKS